MIKLYDCSNSKEYRHTSRGGPVVNDVMRQLREYFHFVEKQSEADVIITNDVFPSYILKDIPRLKRMDGSFWIDGTTHRNKPLDLAAELANAIVYVSKYSQDCHTKRIDFSFSHRHYVALNSASPKEFKKREIEKSYSSRWISVSSDWNREEKRGKSLIDFSSLVKELIVVGRKPYWSIEKNIPKNIIFTGYIEDYKSLSDILSGCDGMFNPSHRDPSPKTVAQAVAIGLPVLYADSGGTREIVRNCGVGIYDPEYDYDSHVRELSFEHIQNGFYKMMDELEKYTENANCFNAEESYENMIGVYRKAIGYFV